MNREAVADRLCHQLNTFESSALSDEQLLALTVLLESFSGVKSEELPRVPHLEVVR
ncbi:MULTISPECIES: hypothetical protein [Gordonia]|uniref:Uncharacterized protein n=1 Tax=Gordonia sputi NBRC 100414 TaxID=1089453 RepID=H5TYF6_9ACTN|nr:MULTISPECIES: hypothetical protein [Gordonia]NKY92753.1 hypothetical protein [Gordonia sputi]GAB38514.1 hypothetical protein GOSPT_045_01520 [Gordonia sputi NBRC 100414]